MMMTILRVGPIAVPYEWLAGAIDRALFGDRTQARLRRRMVPQLRIIE